MTPKVSILFQSTFKPTRATYYGVHDTEDLAFGTHEFRDPFIGTGTKLIELAKFSGNRRSLWDVRAIRIGTRKECEEQLKKLTEGLDYTNPLTLNSKEGWPTGRIPTPEHTEKRATTLLGNQNAVGNKGPNIDIDTPAGTKLKWFNNGSDQKMIVCDMEDNPIKPEYKDWKLGKMHRNPHVQKRLEEIKTEQTAEPDDEQDE